jgi:thiamine biosynthesis lipoprotein
VLVNTGEIMAVGTAPNGSPWPVTIANIGGQSIPLSNVALATSAPLGTFFDAAGSVGHILDPRTGLAGGQWAQVSVTATSAALADGLSTAFCLLDEAEIRAAGQVGVLDILTIA